MKTSHRINVIQLGVFVAILTFPHLLFAAPFSEQHAFCTDRINPLYQLGLSTFEITKSYNACMKKADALIKEHEAATRELQKAIMDMNKKKGERMARDRAERCDVGYRKCIGVNKGRRNKSLCRCLHFKESGSWKQKKKNKRTCERSEQRVKGLKPHDDAPAYDTTGNC